MGQVIVASDSDSQHQIQTHIHKRKYMVNVKLYRGKNEKKAHVKKRYLVDVVVVDVDVVVSD